MAEQEVEVKILHQIIDALGGIIAEQMDFIDQCQDFADALSDAMDDNLVIITTEDIFATMMCIQNWEPSFQIDEGPLPGEEIH